MSRTRNIADGPLALDLMEESFHCLRRAPAKVWLAYYGGTLPFVLALLYFWADMSRGTFANERLVESALSMTGLFIWMKSCHCRFTAHLNASLLGQPTPQWSLADWSGVALRQAAWQPWGLFLLPSAFLLLAPFGWVYAFFQNLTVLDDPRRLTSNSSTHSLLRRAWRQTLLWPGQNHAALFALKGFGLFVFFNLMLATLALPQLLKILFGVETSFTRVMSDPITLITTLFNTTFLSVIVGLTYLCVDPFLKTLYVLRCFYGESLRTGQDLRAELNRWRASPALALAIVLLSTLVCSVQGAEPAPPPSAQLDAGRLNQAIDEVLSSREYRWRLPRQTAEGQSEKSFLVLVGEELMEMAKTALKSVGGWAKKLMNWIFGNRLGGLGGAGSGWSTALRGLLVVLGMVLVFLVVLLLVRTWRQNRPSAHVEAAAVSQVPDLADENVAADQLPEDGWLELARELIARGELRLGLRALYLASLAYLAERQFLTIAKFKSNFDYLRELERRGHVLPDLLQRFGENVAVFDRVWYGAHEVDATLVDHFSRNVDQIRRAA